MEIHTYDLVETYLTECKRLERAYIKYAPMYLHLYKLTMGKYTPIDLAPTGKPKNKKGAASNKYLDSRRMLVGAIKDGRHNYFFMPVTALPKYIGGDMWGGYHWALKCLVNPIDAQIYTAYDTLEKAINKEISHDSTINFSSYLLHMQKACQAAKGARERIKQSLGYDVADQLPHPTTVFFESWINGQAMANNVVLEINSAPVEPTPPLPFSGKPHPAQIPAGKAQAQAEWVAKHTKHREYADSTLKEMFFDPQQYEKLISLLKSPEYNFISESPNGLHWKTSRVKAAILIKALAAENPAILIAPSLFNAEVQAIANNTFAFVGGALNAETVKGAQHFHQKEVFAPLLKKLVRKG